MTPREAAERCGKAKRRGNSWYGLCPCHDDNDPSLKFDEENGKLLWHCTTNNCSQEVLTEALEKLGVHKKQERKKEYDPPIKFYDYRNADGLLVYQTVRTKAKGFWQRRPDGNGGWINKLGNTSPVPYRLPDIRSNPNAIVFVVEGEKDCDNLVAGGFVATCNHGGTGNTKVWPRIASWLAGRHVVILPDNDEPGRLHAARVAAVLTTIAAEVRILDLPDLPPKGDVSDWIDAGHTTQEFEELASTAALFEYNHINNDVKQINGHSPDGGWRALAQTDSNGRLLSNAWNANLILRFDDSWIGVIALDEFKYHSMIMKRPPYDVSAITKYPRMATDTDDDKILIWLQGKDLTKLNKASVRSALASISDDNKFHPIKNYFRSIKWDGINRLDRWLVYYLGCEDIPNYTSSIGRCWMISAVARIFEPGCIAKYALILEGDQDLGKSTALSILGGEWFTDDLDEMGSKDSKMQSSNAWIIELPELESTRRAHINAVKAFISRTTDRFRLPYGRNIVEQPRSCVFAGTVNPSVPYFSDDTGAVRFWPVKCTAIDLSALRADRDQLWAEAIVRYRAGELWFSVLEEEIAAAREEQDARYAFDSWEEVIGKWLRLNAKATCTTTEILQDALKIEVGLHRRIDQMRVASCLKRLKWSPDRTTNVRPRPYVPDK